MQQWWRLYQEALPTLADDDRKEVEDITGCIPLLLRALLRYSGKDFKDVKSKFLEEPELKNVTKQVKEFAVEKKEALNVLQWQSQV